MKLLFEHHAHIGPGDENGKTSLAYAAENGHEAVVKLLLEHDAEIEPPDDQDYTPLHFAVVCGNETVVD